MLEESVVYQDIYRKGEQRGEQRGARRGARRGRQEGAEQEARKLTLRLLEQRLGKLSRTARARIERLVVKQLEALCDAIRDIQTKDDLNRWLEQRAPASRNGASGA